MCSTQLFGLLNHEMSSQGTSTEVIPRLREKANVRCEWNVFRDGARGHAGALLLGCARETPVPRFAGTIVSHIDYYGSGTGTSSQLSSTGQMRTGFDYTDDSKRDWKADIKWAFVRREGGADVYRVEWKFVE